MRMIRARIAWISRTAVERVRAAGEGVTEIHMVSGLHPEKPFAYYLDMVRCLHCEFPHLHIKAFTAAEIHYFAQIAGSSVKSVLSSLKDAGLGSLPGGGAEVLSDRVRAAHMPAQGICGRMACGYARGA